MAPITRAEIGELAADRLAALAHRLRAASAIHPPPGASLHLEPVVPRGAGRGPTASAGLYGAGVAGLDSGGAEAGVAVSTSLLRRWWWLIVAHALVALVAGYAVASSAAAVYEAEARLLVGPINADADTIEAAGQLARTYADLAVSNPLLETSIEDTGAPLTARELGEDVSAVANELTRVVSVRVRSSDADLSVALADALAEALVDTSDPLERPEGALTVIEDADRPDAPTGPGALPIAGLAMITGAVAGLFVAFVLDRRRDAVGSEREVAGITGLPVLASVRLPGRGRLAVRDDPIGDAAVSLRSVASVLDGGDDDPERRTVLVAGCRPGDGSAAVAANLAVALADRGHAVAVSDASGDAEARIANGHDRDAAGAPRVVLVPFDELEAAVAESGRQALDLLIDRLVVHPEPLRSSASALLWAGWADAVVLVAHLDRTGRRELAGAVDGLAAANRDVLGVVVCSGVPPVERARRLRSAAPGR